MSGGIVEYKRGDNKEKSTVVVTSMDGAVRTTSSNNAAGGTENRGGGSSKRPTRHLGDIDGEVRYTGREMRLTAAVAILTILLFGLVSFVVVSGPLTGLLKPRCLDERLGFSGLCDSVECIDISYRSVHSANFSADPCQDFYHFACSKWQSKHPISEEQLYLAANINQLRDSVDGFLKTLLEKETPSHEADPGVTALKNFYKSCMNFTNPNENELILDLLNSFGGYQTPDMWSENRFDLTEVILKFLQVNAAPLIDLTLDIDAKNRERYALIVELPRPTSLVPNLFRPPRQDDDLMNSEFAYYNLIEENEPITSVEMTPGLFNTTSQSSSPRPSSANNGSSNGTGDSSGSSPTNTVDRQALYKVIKDSIDGKKREHLKSLVRKVGQLIRMSEAEILSDSQDAAVIATNIEKIKPSQRSRKFWKQQNKVYNAFTLDQLQTTFGMVNWSFLFGELMGFDDAASRETEPDDYYNRASSSSGSGSGSGSASNNKKSTINWHNSTIYVPYPDYLRRVLQMTQYTNKRMLYNTMLMLYVKDMLHDLMPRGQTGSRKDEQPHQQHPQRSRNQQHKSSHHHHQKQHQQQEQTPTHQQQSPTSQQQPRWKFCVQSTKSVFAMELSSLYMKSFQPTELKRIARDVEEIFENVKETLISYLNRSTELPSLQEERAEEERQRQHQGHHPVPIQHEKRGSGNNSNGGGSNNGSNNNGTSTTVTSASAEESNKSGAGHWENVGGGSGSNSHNSSGSTSHTSAASNSSTDSNRNNGGSKSTRGPGGYKEEAIRKIATLKGNFLGPSFYLREDFLDDAIKNIRIDPNDFLFNVKVVYRTFREQLYNLYWKPVDEERATWAFVTFPTTVNAFYIQQFNSIVIPLAFLSPPHYVERAPVYINYATIALTLAHEALHALDSSGSGFDADGRLQDWWEAEPKAFLQEKTNCLAKQYSDSFRKILPFYQTHVPIQVDGNLTQNENLADIAGLQVAFSAYRKYRLAASKEDLKVERRIPGLLLTLEQAYFLTVAQAYCANISPMGYVFLLEMDEHTPHPERINGMLMNNPDFLEAYQCRLGTQMNPPSKCFVW